MDIIRIFPSLPGCICFGYRHGILWRTLHMQTVPFCWPFWLRSVHPLRQTNWTCPHAHTPCGVLSVFFHRRPISIWENMHIVAGLCIWVHILSNTWLNPPVWVWGGSIGPAPLWLVDKDQYRYVIESMRSTSVLFFRTRPALPWAYEVFVNPKFSRRFSYGLFINRIGIFALFQCF